TTIKRSTPGAGRRRRSAGALSGTSRRQLSASSRRTTARTTGSSTRHTGSSSTTPTGSRRATRAGGTGSPRNSRRCGSPMARSPATSTMRPRRRRRTRSRDWSRSALPKGRGSTTTWLSDEFRTVEAIRELRDEVGAEGGEAIRRLVVDLTRYMELAREMPTGELLYQFLVDSGWLARMSKAATARDEAEVQNISKFF